MWISIIIMMGYLAGLVIGYGVRPHVATGSAAPVYIVIILAVAPAVGITLHHDRDCWRKIRIANMQRVKLKTLAMFCFLSLIWLYASFLAKLGVQPFPTFIADYGLFYFVLALTLPFYIYWADERLSQTEDAYYRFGQLITGQRQWSFPEQKQFLLSSLVKILFIPIMYGALLEALSMLMTQPVLFSPSVIVKNLFLFGLSLDLIIATAGYIFSSPLMRNQVISTDDKWQGWFVCLLCYPPLLFLMQWLREEAEYVYWYNWLSAEDWLYWLWAVLVSLTWICYWLSTAAFGLRFSNLSWRGLVSHGPYRFFKHPAYLSKNVYWWLHAVPFAGFVSVADLLEKVLILTFITLVYYFRALTEERHLRKFPEYVAYAEQVERPWRRSLFDRGNQA